ncbi:transporter substrate-binding domain-containing protein [Terasakiella sp. A23]|uniref:ABC transporter substrate-binding protein n=1 Tax=Terasakiella sp. FCG-A23 TaxID=3080561 RepID=UPI0029537FF7|nr:ABC transporter substrate-binding protein [Terasakiella sp. A23]MDV7339330.1 transporter substrate-binding domain-containing protein [Terasakiella sp. A23]
MIRFFLTFVCLIGFMVPSAYAELPSLRVGVLKFGTVNWELQTIKAYGLDEKAGFKLDVVPFAGKQATATALHGGAVDAIVNDWIWVSRQRSAGQDYSFMPYSRIVGGLVARSDRKIETLADLKGKKLGIAGGPVDKNWLLFQAVAKKRFDLDLAQSTKIFFGAPPLLAKKMEMGELDGVVNFWHYVAKLEAKGHNVLISSKDAMAELGMIADVPMLGYVFAQKTDLMAAFSKASRVAKNLLAKDDAAWTKIRPMMKVADEKTFQALKTGFINGIPTAWGNVEREAAAKLFDVLADLGGEKLVGKGKTLSPDTFAETIRY